MRKMNTATVIIAICLTLVLCSCSNSPTDDYNLPEIPSIANDDGSEVGHALIDAGSITRDVPSWATAAQTHCERYAELNLDGIGTNDDELYISVYSWDDLNADAIVLCVLFGTGNSVAHVIPADDYSFSWGYELHLGKLFSAQRDAVVIEVPIPQSNYRAADLFVLDIVNPQDEYPAVIERMNTQRNQIRLPNGMITDMTSLFACAEPEFVCGSEVIEVSGESLSGLTICLLGETEQMLLWGDNGWALVEPEASNPVAETEIDTYTQENLNLDGNGANDDILTVTTVRPHDGTEGHVAMTVRLGTGQELEYEVTKGRYICNGIFTPYLTSTERQTIVLELAYWGANWAGCDDILLEVKGGAVTEVCVLGDEDTENALNTQSALYGLEVVNREDSPLQALRVPTYVMKWHGPDIGTLTWEDSQWKFVLDGYYTDDWYTAVVDGGMELKISLRGRINRERLIWYYDQIQILHGDTVIQTITEDSFTPDDHCRFDFFNADVPNKTVHVKDINFDGNEDFAVSCNRYHNDGYCWFLYDPQLRQFRYAFSLSGQPELDVEQKQIVETWQDDYGENITYNTYEYNEQGKLTLVESRKESK